MHAGYIFGTSISSVEEIDSVHREIKYIYFFNVQLYSVYYSRPTILRCQGTVPSLLKYLQYVSLPACASSVGRLARS